MTRQGRGTPPRSLFEDAAEAERDPDSESFGTGAWYWPKSWECANPESAYADLKIGPAYLLDAMYSLVARRQNFIIRSGINYLVRACHRNVSRRSVQMHLQVLQEHRFVLCMGNQGDVHRFLLSAQYMGITKRTVAYRNRQAALELIPVHAKKKAAPSRAPKLSRRRQLELAKRFLGEIPPDKLTEHQKKILAGTLDDAFLAGRSYGAGGEDEKASSWIDSVN